jgi:multisubunit Na+/H+ antiporter MnhB subunit
MNRMKAAAIFLLCAGFAIVAAALALLAPGAARSAFAMTGLAVQIFGLLLAFSAHYTLNGAAR